MLSEMPVAAASVGQVYKGYLEGFGEVAVKVQRPGIRETVKKDAALLRSLAELLESIPSPSTFIKIKQDGQSEENKQTKSSTSTKKRLVNTELVSAVDEFMSRIFEELDYTNEANNAATFARLYSIRDGTELEALPNKEGIIVPEIIPELCSKNVIVMVRLITSNFYSYILNVNCISLINSLSYSPFCRNGLRGRNWSIWS